jgi:Zn-dependent M28 family amino/carboxypeptidase
VESRHRNLTSSNVVGILPGTDKALAREHVILTAHLDHVGIKPTEEPDDDEIYNGAMDNASGISAILEVARQLVKAPPKRSVVFIALTAEEKGLNGSDYFARNSTVPSDSMVAVVNLDMPILTYPFTDFIAFGVERSTLYEPIKLAADAYGLALSPDPMPDEGIFTRTDHYNFVKQGVPAVNLIPGFENGGEEAQNEFLKTHYHEASDEVSLVDFVALKKFADVETAITRNITNMHERPVWNAGDFFGDTFGGPMASD